MGRARAYLGNLFPDIDIDRLDAKAGADDRIRSLEDDVERLSMAVRALSDLLVKKKCITHVELRDLIAAIDAADGTTDGTSMRIPTGRPDDAKKKSKK